MIPSMDREEYVAVVLDLYLKTAETPTRANPQDRQRAAELHNRGIDVSIIESAFLLASIRRLGRSHDLPPLTPIRSLAYFLPVIDEVLNNPCPSGYLEYLREKVKSFSASMSRKKSGLSSKNYVFR